MENYIVINGKKAELTEEQLKALGIETKKAETSKEKFERKFNQRYYAIHNAGVIYETIERNTEFDDRMHNSANYCTDKQLMKQRALHEILDRKLWRFACENGELENEWNCDNRHYYVYCIGSSARFCIHWNTEFHLQAVNYFPTEEIAQRAIKEIIKPFMEEHPDFVW